MNTTALVAVTLAELALVFLVLLFFVRLRRSEQMLSTLQANQDDLMDRMLRNAELEQEMVASFAQRQQELTQLNRVMEERIASLRKLLEQAEGITCSPHFLRERAWPETKSNLFWPEKRRRQRKIPKPIQGPPFKS